MLKLNRTELPKNYNIEIDYYVPFTIEIEHKDIFSSKVYWRTGNLKTSILEIGLDEKTGLLRDITLVSVDKAFSIDVEHTQTIHSTDTGVPVFDIQGDIRNKLCDISQDIFVFLSTNDITVRFGDNIDFSRVNSLGRIYFMFDENNILISISITNLSDYEYSELKESLKL
ncbi:hypothetical protein ABE099_16815 [Paenibacillus turicensis]|uniref:hypothetical protein n=1 Tax=Paenibacillus turicensis TaxID=160487 RepID=UPI003D2D5DCF